MPSTETSIKEKHPFSILFLLGLAILVYVVLISKLSILRYSSFHANMFDMGINIQAIWNTVHGRMLTETINMGFPVQKLWFGHWEWIFLPIALIFAIFPSPNTLFIIQSLFLASGAVAIFGLTTWKLKNQWVALILAVMYLLYPALQNANLFDFHGLTLATGPLLFAFYFMVTGKKKWFYFFTFLSLLCREDVALIVMMFGLYDFLFLKNKKEGTGLVLVGFVWFLAFISRAYLYELLQLPPLPAVEQAPSHWAHLGANSPVGIIVAIFKRPLYVVKFLFSGENIKYGIKLFAPIGFISFLSPSTIWLMAPTLFINLMSSWPHTKSIEYQYTATITPIVFISLIYGLAVLKRFFEVRKKKWGMTIFYLIIAGIFGISFLAFRFKSLALNYSHWRVNTHDRIAEKIAKSIPQEASVSAETYLGTHASMRRYIYPMTMHFNESDFVFYDFYRPNVSLYTKPGFDMSHLSPMNSFILTLLQNREYGVSSFQDGITLFQKGYPYKKGLENLCFGRKREIQNPALKNVTSDILYLGNTQHKSGGEEKRILHYTLFWKKIHPFPISESFIFLFKHNQMQIVFSHRPVFGLYSPDAWPVNQIIRDEFFYSISPKIKHGIYEVYLKVKSRQKIEKGKQGFMYLFKVTL